MSDILGGMMFKFSHDRRTFRTQDREHVLDLDHDRIGQNIYRYLETNASYVTALYLCLLVMLI